MNLDFTDIKNLPDGNEENPYESFNSVQKILYEDFFKNLHRNLESKFQLLIEMSVEFVKSESSEEEESWEYEGNFYSGDGISECVEQRSLNEYSAFSTGSVLHAGLVYDDVVSSLSQKVLNSYNVTGSNWSLRRIISSNLSILHNIDSMVFNQRLVKGRTLSNSDVTTEQQQQQQQVASFDSERFTKFFHMCYDKLHWLATTTNSKTTGPSTLPISWSTKWNTGTWNEMPRSTWISQHSFPHHDA